MQWGLKMQDDLTEEGGHWAIAKTRPNARQGRHHGGGSYGGYATLAALTLTPEKFACGVDIVGPSNLFTLLETIPPYG